MAAVGYEGRGQDGVGRARTRAAAGQRGKGFGDGHAVRVDIGDDFGMLLGEGGWRGGFLVPQVVLMVPGSRWGDNAQYF